MKSLVGIYTRPHDDHFERVISELERRRLPWIRFDTQNFPQELCLAVRFDGITNGWQGDFVLHNSPYRLEDIKSIWYRRPTKTFCFPSTLSDDGREYAQAEAQKGFSGLLHGLSTLWVSHPDMIRAAEWKPKQLEYARQVGFHIPKTLITNNPQAVFDFFDECQGEIIYKPFNQGVPRPKIGEPWKGAIYTTKVSRALLQEHASTLSLTANLFQQHIPKAFELRITVIGTHVFAAEIHSQQSERTRIDFRKAYADLTYRIHQLPEHIEHACRLLVQRFQLYFSAIDMIVTPEQEYIFLESNPCGQWGWIETQTGLPLTATQVDLLSNATEEGK